MKKCIPSNLVLILSFFLMMSGFSQSPDNVLIGNIKNKTLSITNQEFLTQLFDAELGKSGFFDFFEVQYDPDGKLVFVKTGVIGNKDNINAIGVSLIVRGHEVYYVKVTENKEDFLNTTSQVNTCRSIKCRSCNLVVRSWKPFSAGCEKGEQGDILCDCSHSVKMSIIDKIELRDNSILSKSKVKAFKFSIEKNGNEVILISKKGFNWKKLGFTSEENFPATITKTGVIATDYKNSKAESSIIFTVEKTPEGFNLEGIKGTNWTSLTVSCKNDNCRQIIDQNGIINK